MTFSSMVRGYAGLSGHGKATADDRSFFGGRAEENKRLARVNKPAAEVVPYGWWPTKGGSAAEMVFERKYA
jgi:hypothetical protein